MHKQVVHLSLLIESDQETRVLQTIPQISIFDLISFIYCALTATLSCFLIK